MCHQLYLRQCNTVWRFLAPFDGGPDVILKHFYLKYDTFKFNNGFNILRTFQVNSSNITELFVFFIVVTVQHYQLCIFGIIILLLGTHQVYISGTLYYRSIAYEALVEYRRHCYNIVHSQSPNNGILKNNCCNIPFQTNCISQ